VSPAEIAAIEAVEAKIDEETGLAPGERQAVQARLFFAVDRKTGERSAAGKLREACYNLLIKHKLRDEIPTGNRFLFYELEQTGDIAKKRDDLNPKTGKKIVRRPDTYLAEALTDLSEEGLIPWDWLNDETRDMVMTSGSGSILEDLPSCLPICRIDPWDETLAPLTITESRAVKGALARVARQYVAPLTSVGGMSRRHIVNEIAPLLRGNDRTVLYFGDWEVGGPGDQIEDHVRRTLEEHTGRSFTVGIDWIRIALTKEQVDADPRLAALVIEKTDNRYTRSGGKTYPAVEAEALGQGVIVGIYRDRLDRTLAERGLDSMESVQAREGAERAEVADLLDEIIEGRRR
jgi:hypothetical protein